MTDTVNPGHQQPEPSLLKYRIKLLALIGVFILPFIAGWLAFYVFDYRPGSKNYGELVIPVRKMELPDMTDWQGNRHSSEFWDKWTFVILQNGECAELCRNNLHYLRQMRTALGRDSDRIHNVLLNRQHLTSSMQQFLADYPDLTVFHQVPDQVISGFELPRYQAGEAPVMYLLDPDNNLMMTYPAVHDPSSVLSDLRRLLRISQIG